MSCLDVKMILENKAFTIFVYHKLAFSGVCTHFDRFYSSTYKLGTIFELAYGWFLISSSWNKLDTELVCLKEVFLKNGQPSL